jgi:hypothetical protein
MNRALSIATPPCTAQLTLGEAQGGSRVAVVQRLEGDEMQRTEADLGEDQLFRRGMLPKIGLPSSQIPRSRQWIVWPASIALSARDPALPDFAGEPTIQPFF